MTDKYEEFRSWVFYNSKTRTALQIILILFHMFEEEQSKSEKEEDKMRIKLL